MFNGSAVYYGTEGETIGGIEGRSKGVAMNISAYMCIKPFSASSNSREMEKEVRRKGRYGDESNQVEAPRVRKGR